MRFRGAVLTGSIAALAWLAPGVAQAAPPLNDPLSGAVALTVGSSVTGTLSEATTNSAVVPPDPVASSGNPGERNVWYAFHAPAAGTWTVDVCGPGAGTRPNLRIYDNAGPPPALLGTAASLSCADGTGGNEQSFTTTAAKDIRLMVYDGGGASTSFTIRLATGPNTQALVFKPAIADARAIAYGQGTSAANTTCGVDAAPAGPCNASISLAGVADGPHTLHATSRDAFGNPDATPLSYPFVVDHAAPDTTIAVDDASPASPVLNLTSPDPDVVVFQCSVDGLPYAICDGGSQEFRDLCAGTHTFQARGMDEWSNVDPTPASATYTVPGAAPCGPPAVKVGALGLNPSSLYATAPVSVQTGGRVLSAYVEYGPTDAYGFRTPDMLFGRNVTPAEYGGSIGAQTALLGVAPGSTLHYRAVAVGADGSVTRSDSATATAPAPTPGAATITIGTPTVTQTTADIPFTVNSPLSAFTPTLAALFDFRSLTAFPYVDTEVVASDGLQHGGTFHLTGLTPGTRYELNGFTGSGQQVTSTGAFAVTTASPPGPPGHGGGGGGGGGTPPGPGPGTGSPKPPVKAKNPLGRLTLPKKSLLRVLKTGSFKPKLACKSACRLRIRLLKGKVTIALGTAKRTKAGTSTITLKPTSAGRRAIKKVRRGKKLKLVLLAEALDPSGKKAIGSIRRTLTFR